MKNTTFVSWIFLLTIVCGFAVGDGEKDKTLLVSNCQYSAPELEAKFTFSIVVGGVAIENGKVLTPIDKTLRNLLDRSEMIVNDAYLTNSYQYEIKGLGAASTALEVLRREEHYPTALKAEWARLGAFTRNVYSKEVYLFPKFILDILGTSRVVDPTVKNFQMIWLRTTRMGAPTETIVDCTVHNPE